MKIYLFDTLSKQKNLFRLIIKILEFMFAVQLFTVLVHLNARMAVVTDLLVKVLKQKYKHVTFVSNIN